MSCRCVKYHSFGITVFEISDGRYIYIYITEPRCGRDLKRPLHRLVRQLRSSSLDPTTLGRKVQKRCARQKKKVLNVLASARVVCLWQSVREWSEACSLLYFFPLDEEKKNKLPVVTVSLKKFSGS
jgi:hypothetical protein